MKRVEFGRSKAEVSEYCLGCLTMGRLQSNLSVEAGARIITTAIKNGVNFIDTAELYGNDEQIHRALELLRDESPALIEDVVIATKTKATTRHEMESFVDKALELFGKDTLDIVDLHNIAGEKAFKEREGAFQSALTLKDEGKINELGWTSHSVEGLAPALDHADEVSVLMPVVNFNGTGLRGFTLDDLLSLLKEAKGKDMSIYSMKSLGGGHLRESAREAIQWLRDHPLIDVACIGAKSPHEVVANIHVFNDEPVPIEVAGKIAMVPRRVIIYHHLCQKCGRCAEACTSGALDFNEASGPVIDHETCLICGYCAAACPKFIIRVV